MRAAGRADRRFDRRVGWLRAGGRSQPAFASPPPPHSPPRGGRCARALRGARPSVVSNARHPSDAPFPSASRPAQPPDGRVHRGAAAGARLLRAEAARGDAAECGDARRGRRSGEAHGAVRGERMRAGRSSNAAAARVRAIAARGPQRLNTRVPLELTATRSPGPRPPLRPSASLGAARCPATAGCRRRRPCVHLARAAPPPAPSLVALPPPERSPTAERGPRPPRSSERLLRPAQPGAAPLVVVPPPPLPCACKQGSRRSPCPARAPATSRWTRRSPRQGRASFRSSPKRRAPPARRQPRVGPFPPTLVAAGLVWRLLRPGAGRRQVCLGPRWILGHRRNCVCVCYAVPCSAVQAGRMARPLTGLCVS